jgi:hypothetical protein
MTYTFGGFGLYVRDAGETAFIRLTTLDNTDSSGIIHTVTQTVNLSDFDLSFLTEPPFTFFLIPETWEEFNGSGVRLHDWWIDAQGGGWTVGYIGLGGGVTQVPTPYHGST